MAVAVLLAATGGIVWVALSGNDSTALPAIVDTTEDPPWEPIDTRTAVATLDYLEEHGPALQEFDELTEPILDITVGATPTERCREVAATLEERIVLEDLFTLTAEVPDEVLASLWLDAQWARSAAVAFCLAGDAEQMRSEAEDALRVGELLQWRLSEATEARG